jgi:hypothetical protein
MMIKFTNVFITISYAATGLYRENAEDRLLQRGNFSPVVPGAPGSQPGAFLPSVSSNYLFTQSHIVVDNLPPHLSVFSKPFFLQELAFLQPLRAAYQVISCFMYLQIILSHTFMWFFHTRFS